MNTKFTAQRIDSEEEITGYYCPHFFEDSVEPQPAITIIQAMNITTSYRIKPETLRPAEGEEMTEKEKETILTDYLQDLMKTNINGFMVLIGGILKQVSDNANSGQLKITISDKKDNPLWTLLFATDEDLIPQLDNFLNEYDKQEPTS